MENINCVGCKWLRVDKFSCVHYCQLTSDTSHRTALKNDTVAAPIVPDNGVCPGWVSEIEEVH